MQNNINIKATAVCSKILYPPVQKALLADQHIVNQQKLRDFTGRVCLKREYDLAMAKLINLGLMPSASIEFIVNYLNKTCRILMRDHKINMQFVPEFNLDTSNFVYSLSMQNDDAYLAYLIRILQQVLNAHKIPNTYVAPSGLDPYVQVLDARGNTICEIRFENSMPYILLGETDEDIEPDANNVYATCLNTKYDIDYLNKIMNIIRPFMSEKEKED